MRGKLHLEDWISAKLKWLRHSPSVMPGLDLGIHLSSQERSRCWRWLAGSSPAMTAAYHRVTCADTASHFPYNGEANFPEFHNVYIDPCSYAAYKKTSVFPEGTMFFKKLQLTLPGQNSDGSRTEPSGRGYFPGQWK